MMIPNITILIDPPGFDDFQWLIDDTLLITLNK